MSMSALASRLYHWERWAWLAALVGLLLVGVAFWVSGTDTFKSYWFAWVFWTGLGLGGLSMLMLHRLTPGRWNHFTRMPAEAATHTLPWMALLLLPVAFGMETIFPWPRPGYFDGLEMPHKAAFYQVSAFWWRNICYMLIFVLLARRMRRGHGRRGGAIGVILFGIILLFASTDWIMSLDPKWYSSMFVVIALVSQFLSALAFFILLIGLFARSEGYRAELSPQHLHDLGNMLLAFVTFWMYVTFSQFMLIWSADLPHEIVWYEHRGHGGWQWVAAAIVLVQFAIPFALLLSRARKRHHRRLWPIAAIVWVAGILYIYWLIRPNYHPEGLSISWLDPLLFLAIGAFWIALFLNQLRKEPLMLTRTKPAHA